MRNSSTDYQTWEQGTQTDDSEFMNSMIVRMPVPSGNLDGSQNYAKIMISIWNGNLSFSNLL